MTDTEKIGAIADIFDADVSEITPDTELDSLNWDSVAMISVIALAKAQGKSVASSVIREMETISDIMDVL